MDWEKNVSDLKTGSDMPEFLKLEAGTHKVTFLDEGKERIQHWEDKEIPKVDFKVKYNEKEYVWSVTKGQTIGSLYGQIALLGRQLGTIAPTEVTVIVKGAGKNKDYTILESADLADKEIKSREPVKEEKVE